MYDFGQLDTDTESEYVIQIVKNRVHSTLRILIHVTDYLLQLGNECDLSTITAISHVLSWSQQYMKEQEVC